MDKPARKKPTIHELEAILEEAPGSIEILPSGEIVAVDSADVRLKAAEQQLEAERRWRKRIVEQVGGPCRDEDGTRHIRFDCLELTPPYGTANPTLSDYTHSELCKLLADQPKEDSDE